MPLTAFNSAVDGCETSAALPLKREMAQTDFSIGTDEFKSIGFMNAFLYSTFDEGVLQVDGLDEYEAGKRALVAFLNDEIKGPYYVHEGMVNTRTTLHIVLFGAEDVKTFADHYPKWRFNEDSAQKNAAVLAKWKQVGRTLKNNSLFDYAAP